MKHSIPKFPDRAKGPNSVASATYPSRGPAGELSGFEAALFKFVSKLGKTVVASAKNAVDFGSSHCQNEAPIIEQKTRRAAGLVLFISFATREATSADSGVPESRRNVM